MTPRIIGKRGAALQVMTLLVVLAAAAAGGMQSAGASDRKAPKPAGEPKAAGCTGSEYHQFDFWLGDWDVFDAGDPKTIVAHVRVDPILNGCALHEQYSDPTGLVGESFSIYAASRRLWHQTWVTNRGQLLVIEGTFDGTAMVLSGVEQKAGQHTEVRATWKAVAGGVRETAVTSTDGTNWKTWFDLMFRRRCSSRH